MRKFFAILLLIILCAISCVSATSLANHDFGNFSADIPADSQIDTYASGVIHNVDSRTLSSGGLQDALENSPDVHKFYKDGVHNITYDYLKKPENGTYADTFESGAKELDQENGLICYELSSGSDTEYCVIKEQGGFLIFPADHYVKLTGPDLDLLKEIGATIKF